MIVRVQLIIVRERLLIVRGQLIIVRKQVIIVREQLIIVREQLIIVREQLIIVREQLAMDQTQTVFSCYSLLLISAAVNPKMCFLVTGPKFSFSSHLLWQMNIFWPPENCNSLKNV